MLVKRVENADEGRCGFWGMEMWVLEGCGMVVS